MSKHLFCEYKQNEVEINNNSNNNRKLLNSGWIGEK